MALSRLLILGLGAAYPAYGSYKVLKSKNHKLYGKWMMYWIAFASFTCGEAFADALFDWFPFYYMCKVIFVLWLLSPATKGSSILYRKLIRPLLKRKETEIDSYIFKIKQAVRPLTDSASSTASLNSNNEGKLQIKQIRESGENRLMSTIMEVAQFWTSDREFSEDTDPYEIEVNVKYRSGTTTLLF